MAHLTLTVRWLAEEPASASYHGDDWPPSPLRVYQALVAAAGHARPPEADAALDHLAALPPPVIWAPHPQARSPVATAVPNNDGDKVMEHFAKDRVAKGRKAISSLRTIRHRAGWRLDAPIHYVWRTGTGTDAHLPALKTLCAAVTAVGQGIDLAWVTMRLSKEEPRGEGLRHSPAENGANRLKTPYPGVLEVLDRRHDAFRSRVGRGAVSGLLEPRHQLVGYQSPLSLPARRSAAFALRTPDDTPWSVAGDNGVLVAAMTRHAIHQAARRAGLDDVRIRELMGHGDSGRIQTWPVPNVGHRWADGRIRRVLLTCSTQVPEDEWAAVLYRVAGVDLTPVGAAEPMAMLAPAAEDDALLWRFTGRAMRWTTATPLVLPGWDTRRGKPRPARTARRLLQHAQIPQEAVEAVEFEPAAMVVGAHRPGDYRVSKHLEAYPRANLTIRFREPVTGPLCLGAGTGIGMGLLTVCETSGGGARARERSHAA